MQFQSELDMRASRTEADTSPLSEHRPKRSCKMTVRLTEELYNRLCTATDRPGVGKSMLVEAALEQFLSAAPTAEDVMRERFDDMDLRFDRLERDMRMMAETVALHARYHLCVMPPLPQSRQHEAVRLGDERFKVLAEQVDRRVRVGRSLMEETIERLNSTDRVETQSAPLKQDPGPSSRDQKRPAEGVDVNVAFSAAVGEGGSNSYFRRRPN